LPGRRWQLPDLSWLKNADFSDGDDSAFFLLRSQAFRQRLQIFFLRAPLISEIPPFEPHRFLRLDCREGDGIMCKVRLKTASFSDGDDGAFFLSFALNTGVQAEIANFLPPSSIDFSAPSILAWIPQLLPSFH
jgi:hypothetical protein